MNKSTQINAAKKAEETRLRQAAHERVRAGTFKMEKLTPATPVAAVTPRAPPEYFGAWGQEPDTKADNSPA